MPQTRVASLRPETQHPPQAHASDDVAITPAAVPKPAAAPKPPGSCPESALIEPDTVCRALRASPGATARALAAALCCEEAAVLPALRQAHSDFDVYCKGAGPDAAWFPC